MFRYAPSNAGGIGGQCRDATAEEIRFMNDFTNNYFIGGTKLSGLIPTETTTLTTAMINKGNAKALPLKNPGGPSLKHFVASRLNAVHLIAD